MIYAPQRITDRLVLVPASSDTGIVAALRLDYSTTTPRGVRQATADVRLKRADLVDLVVAGLDALDLGGIAERVAEATR